MEAVVGQFPGNVCVIRVLMGQRCPAKCTCTIMLHTRAQEHFIIGKVGGGNEQ